MTEIRGVLDALPAKRAALVAPFLGFDRLVAKNRNQFAPRSQEATAEMAEEEGPCEWEGELDDGFPTGQVSHPTRSTPNTRVSTFTPPARE